MSGSDPRAALDAGLRISRVTEADRMAWRAWATERAQDAFRRGREATELGQFVEARRWLERAHRLARDSSTVIFPLAVARLQTGDPIGAISLLQNLLRRFDQRECWVMLAAARTAAHQVDQAAHALGEALRRHAPDRSMLKFLSDTARAAGWPGWCGLSGDGTLHAIQAGDGGGALDILLDGAPIKGRLRNGRIALPAGWNRARFVTVQRNGTPLLGSPVDIAAVIRTEGFVEAVDGMLTGWVWHPAEPERCPEVIVRDGAGRIARVAMDELAEIPTADAPLARPRLLRFKPEQLGGLDMASGPVTVEGSDGRPLAGSPLDPGLEHRAAAALAAIQAEASRIAAFARAGLPAPVQPLGPPPAFLPVPAALIGTCPAIGPARETDVVVPVFKHLRRTLDCLESVLAAMPKGGRLVVVEDRSPDDALVSALVSMEVRNRIVLIRRPENGGFPASANDGIAACAGRDVVLLNADTLVAPGWLEALRHGAYSAAAIGTATPFSNEATILSYPNHLDRNPCPDLAGTRRMMALAAAANGDAVVDIPTGHGFCLYLRRDCLDQVGLLREDLFAQGYGEENDFCLRARHLGWRHVAVPGAFVAHEGNVSFGAARTGLMRRNGEILNRLHPGYDALIAEHIAADPLAPARFRFDAARWAALRRKHENRQSPRAVLLITHAQGGGVDRVVQERARRIHAQGLRPIVLRPDGDGVVLSDLSTEERFPNLRFALPGEFEALVAFLRPDGVVHAEWHHLLGHHAALRGLCARLGIPFDAFVHDYAWFCQRIALVGPQGRYCGEPDPAGCERCIAVQGSNLAETITVPALLKRSARELAEARRVIAPSEDAARRIARHFPGIRPEISPWEADRPDLSLARLAAVSSPTPRAPGRRAGGPDRPARIVVIGAIGREKGYDVLLNCLIDARARALPLEFVVVGHTPDDTALMEQGCLFVTGEYREEDGVGLVAEQEADFAFLPSIWPETWCFTLSVAWRAGLPVAAFDIGAQADRIRATGRGAVLPLGLPVSDLNTVLLRLCRPGGGTARQTGPHGAVVAERGARPIAKRTLSSHHP